MRPKWPFWKHHAPNCYRRLVEVKCTHRKHCHPEISLGRHPISPGRTPKGSYSPRGRSRHLLETPFSEPLLRTLLRTLFYCKNHRKTTPQNPSENPSPEPFPKPSQNPSQNAVLPYDPLGVQPILGSHNRRAMEGICLL